MDIGAIGFHDNSQVRSLRVEKNNATVKQLEKTKKVILLVRSPNFLILSI